jgi:hypothetical protein
MLVKSVGCRQSADPVVFISVVEMLLGNFHAKMAVSSRHSEKVCRRITHVCTPLIIFIFTIG